MPEFTTPTTELEPLRCLEPRETETRQMHALEDSYSEVP
jgi:alpha-D-ribose 1-methylphosphonate 5-phosphate C-P lyase